MNPHEEVQENAVVSATDLFGNATLARYTFKKGKINPRGEIYRAFMQVMNPLRVARGNKPLTETRMGFLTAGVNSDDLLAFLYKCEKSKNFAATFNGAFFPKQKPPVTAAPA